MSPGPAVRQDAAAAAKSASVPCEVRGLDLIPRFYEYHEMPNVNVDRAAMARRLFDAFKSGGAVVIAHHSARPGNGVSAIRSLHRIGDVVVRRDLEQAWFQAGGAG
jgi:predicted methyltransferase